jgi:prephenate dehydrogenase
VERVLNRPVVVMSIPVDTIGAITVTAEAAPANPVVVDTVSVKILLTVVA